MMRRFGLLLALTLGMFIGLSLAPSATNLVAPACAAPEEQDAHAADAGHAADDHGGDHAAAPPSPIAAPKEGIASAVTALICFGVVLAVLYVKVWPLITKGLDERAEKIREEIASAEAARKQAKDALDEYEKNLAQARAEANRMLEETKAKQAELAAELRAKADVELGELRDRARRDIEAAKKAALNEIYAESVALASTMASKILGREIGPQDQGRLVEESLSELQASRN